MPIYEYRCGACGFQKEYLQRITDARLTDCPECGKPALNKMVTAAGFQLKGSGWYATDFKNNGVAKPSESKSGGTKSNESKSGDTSGDTKTSDTKSSDSKSGDTKASASKSDDAPKKSDSKVGAVSGTGASPASN
jgi:putative FmdB family regulatory protein